jgi:putative restriction endonuclease
MSEPPDQPTRDQDIIDRFARVTMWKRGGERAPHKPLLILLSLARLQRGEPRLIGFDELYDPLRRLLIEFGPCRKSFHPEYPFWHLQSDGLWEIPQIDEFKRDLASRSRQNNPPKSVLLRVGAEGGLPEHLHRRLRRDPALVNDIVSQILEDNWEPSYHSDILDAVAMPWVAVRTRRPRDPAFRDTILRIYEHRCAVCGYDGQLDNTDLGIEAAHGRWHAAGGSDIEDNGVALCSFHHKALDRGAIGLDDDRRILVSQHVRGSQGVGEWLFRFIGRPIRPPLQGEPAPAAGNIDWHRREVFRKPHRARTGP